MYGAWQSQLAACTEQHPHQYDEARTGELTTTSAMWAGSLCGMPRPRSIFPFPSSISKCRMAYLSVTWATAPLMTWPR